MRSPSRVGFRGIGVVAVNLDNIGLPPEESVENRGIKMRTSTIFKNGEAFFQRESFLVGPLRAQCVEHIGHGSNASFKGNVLPGEPGGYPVPFHFSW